MEQSKKRQIAVDLAMEMWGRAPAHIKVMASAYVEPILRALNELSAELDLMKGATHGEK